MPAPERRHRAKCRRCNAPIVWARTTAGRNGGGGRAMPLDYRPNEDGNVAARIGPGHQIIARVLAKDEDHDHHAEWRAMPHFATCAQEPRQQEKRFADQVETWLAEKTTTSEGADQ